MAMCQLAWVLGLTCGWLDGAAAAGMDIMVLGDWGGQTAAPYWVDTQVENTAGMDAYATETAPRAGLLIGDNFYSYGIRCDDDKDPKGWVRATKSRRPCTEDAMNYRFQETFERVMDAPALAFPMYSIAGNHDHRGNVTAQVEYGTLGTKVPGSSGRWRFPYSDGNVEHTWYTFNEDFEAEADGSTVSVQFFMLDTVRWCGLCNSDSGDFNAPRYFGANMTRSQLVRLVGGEDRYRRASTACGGEACCIFEDWSQYRDTVCHKVSEHSWGWTFELRCPLDNHLSSFAAEQRSWLEAALAASTADWKVVVGHYPVFSVSGHGPTPRLLKELAPLLEAYRVALYFNGHDHSAQHISVAPYPSTDFFNIGAGSPVSNSRGEEDTVLNGKEWFVGDSTRPEIEASETALYHSWGGDPNALKFFYADRGETTSRGMNASFAGLHFKDSKTATVDVIDTRGCVLYRHTKLNPNRATEAELMEWRDVTTGVAAGLPCYERGTHIPAAVAQFESAKQQAAMMSWAFPMLVGVVGGVLLSACKRRLCPPKDATRGYNVLTRESTAAEGKDGSAP